MPTNRTIAKPHDQDGMAIADSVWFLALTSYQAGTIRTGGRDSSDLLICPISYRLSAKVGWG